MESFHVISSEGVQCYSNNSTLKESHHIKQLLIRQSVCFKRFAYI